MLDLSLPPIPQKYNISPEFRLLAACSWIAPPTLERDQAQKIIALCSSEINWETFLTLVDAHDVQALAYETLRRYADATVPGNIMAALKNRKIQISARSLQQAAELFGLNKTFAAQGIDLLPLKGVMLSLQLYGNLGMRNSCDLDIMVKPENIDAVCQLLEAEGYKCIWLGAQMTPKQRVHLRTNFHHLQYANATESLCLELHWSFGSLWRPNQVEMLWNNIKQIEWMGSRIYRLEDDSQLLFLCDHGSKHGFSSLKWLSDIARLFSSERPQGWENLLELAENLDLKRTLAHTTLLVHWIYNIPLPKVFCELICKDKHAVSISINAYNQLVLNQFTTNSMGKPQGSLKLAWQVLLLRQSLPIGMALKPRMIALLDFIDFPLPDSLFWLYYPLRPVSLFWRHFLKK